MLILEILLADVLISSDWLILFDDRNFELVATMLLLPHQLVKKAWISWKLILSYVLMLMFHL